MQLYQYKRRNTKESRAIVWWISGLKGQNIDLQQEIIEEWIENNAYAEQISFTWRTYKITDFKTRFFIELLFHTLFFYTAKLSKYQREEALYRMHIMKTLQVWTGMILHLENSGDSLDRLYRLFISRFWINLYQICEELIIKHDLELSIEDVILRLKQTDDNLDKITKNITEELVNSALTQPHKPRIQKEKDKNQATPKCVEDEKEYLSPKTVCSIYKVSSSTLQRCRESGRIKEYKRHKNSYHYSKNEIEQLFKKRISKK